MNETVPSDDVIVRLAHLDEARVWRGDLNDAEQDRAESIRNPAVRARYIVSRGLRRRLLSDCTGCEPRTLGFVEEEGGKPRLAVESGLDFNISHAGDYVAAAAGRAAVGIDLELIRDVREMAGVVRRYFHPDEAAAWEDLEAGGRTEGFFILWCAREAAMKCTGIGLARGLSATRVEPSILVEAAAAARVGKAELRVKRMDAPPGYVMVLAQA